MSLLGWFLLDHSKVKEPLGIGGIGRLAQSLDFTHQPFDHGFQECPSSSATATLENYPFLTLQAKIKKFSLHGGSTRAILSRFSNTVTVAVWEISLFPQVNHGEIKPSRSSFPGGGSIITQLSAAC